MRGDVVVEEALGDVQDALPGQAEALDRELEVAVGGLVGARLLGGDDDVELDAEPPPRGLEEVVVAVRHDREPEAGAERRERGRGVLERGPIAHRGGEGSGLTGLGLEAEVGADPLERPGEDVGVAPVLARLELGLVASVELKQLLVGDIGAVVREDRPERGEEAALPVDQGPVAVEGERLEGREIEFRRRASDR